MGPFPQQRGHAGQPLPGSVCKGSQTAEFPTAALVLITANQWMPDSGQSKLLPLPSRGRLGRWAPGRGRGAGDGGAGPRSHPCVSQCPVACASCPACFSPVPVLTVPQPCCAGVLAAPAPTLQVLLTGHCSALGHFQLLPAARLPPALHCDSAPLPRGVCTNLSALFVLVLRTD